MRCKVVTGKKRSFANTFVTLTLTMMEKKSFLDERSPIVYNRHGEETRKRENEGADGNPC